LKHDGQHGEGGILSFGNRLDGENTYPNEARLINNLKTMAKKLSIG